MWGCFLMSGVKILHFLKDWWKSIPIHQNYTMALKQDLNNTTPSSLNSILIIQIYETVGVYAIRNEKMKLIITL